MLACPPYLPCHAPRPGLAEALHRPPGASLRLIAELDEFKGRWQALGQLAPERLTSLRRVATVESIGLLHVDVPLRADGPKAQRLGAAIAALSTSLRTRVI